MTTETPIDLLARITAPPVIDGPWRVAVFDGQQLQSRGAIWAHDVQLNDDAWEEYASGLTGRWLSHAHPQRFWHIQRDRNLDVAQLGAATRLYVAAKCSKNPQFSNQPPTTANPAGNDDFHKPGLYRVDAVHVGGAFQFVAFVEVSSGTTAGPNGWTEKIYWHQDIKEFPWPSGLVDWTLRPHAGTIPFPEKARYEFSP